jgi:hypothetical protein
LSAGSGGSSEIGFNQAGAVKVTFIKRTIFKIGVVELAAGKVRIIEHFVGFLASTPINPGGPFIIAVRIGLIDRGQ